MMGRESSLEATRWHSNSAHNLWLAGSGEKGEVNHGVLNLESLSNSRHTVTLGLQWAMGWRNKAQRMTIDRANSGLGPG